MKVFGIKIIFILAVVFFTMIFGFTPSQKGVNPIVEGYYKSLKSELGRMNFDSTKIMIISSKRSKGFNDFLRKMGTASENSQHLQGNAIDVLVFDVDRNGKTNAEDVDIVYSILDEKIVKDKGGVGTYKNKKGLYAARMVHFDCRGYKVRWHY